MATREISHEDLVTDYLALTECVHGLLGRVALLESRVALLEQGRQPKCQARSEGVRRAWARRRVRRLV